MHLNITSRSQHQVLFFSGRSQDLPWPGVAPPLTSAKCSQWRCILATAHAPDHVTCEPMEFQPIFAYSLCNL